MMTETIKPFSPADAANAKINMIPKEVIEVVNAILAAKIHPLRPISIKQHEIINGAREKMTNGSDYANSDFFTKGWLEIEPLYQAEGWKVSYHRPSYDEDFEAYFEFTAKKTPE